MFDAERLGTVVSRAEPDAVINQLTDPGVYNVVDDEPATAAQWMPVYAEALGTKRPPRVPAFVARLIAGGALVEWIVGLRGASNEKIKGELGWRPRHESWRQGLFGGIG